MIPNIGIMIGAHIVLRLSVVHDPQGRATGEHGCADSGWPRDAAYSVPHVRLAA